MSVGRNDPCPCGSKKKYKNCCLSASTGTPDISALIMKGGREYNAGHLATALATFNEAIALNSTVAMAFIGRGYTYLQMGNTVAMAADLTRAKELDPNNYDIHFSIGKMLFKIRDYKTAIAALSSAIEINPNFEESWLMLADGYYRIGSPESAYACYAEILKLFPDNPTAKLEMAYMLSPIADSREQIEAQRAAVAANLAKLRAEKFRLTKPETQVMHLPFYQAYHHLNNKEFAKNLADFFYDACPNLGYVAPHTQKPLQLGEKIKLGIHWSFIFTNLDQFFVDVLKGLAEHPDFDVLLIISDASPGDPAIARLTQHVKRHTVIPTDFDVAHKQIAKEQLDILLYTEVGMHVQTYLLAMSRLAHVQCFWGGHPMTSGLRSMDYYTSCALYEAENPAEHYTEKLTLFERNPSIFKRPNIPVSIPTREQLGLPETGRIYCCPVTLYKLHPDMDGIFKNILLRDPQATIILFDGHHIALWRASLQQRFLNHMGPELAARIVFLPFANKERFFQILKSCDAILDTVHFTFGTTAFLLLAAGVPFVSWPGEFLRGRQSYGLCKQIGVMDLIAKDYDHYVELALKLAQDSEFKYAISQKILAQNAPLFDDPGMVDMFASHLKAMLPSINRA